MERMNLGRVVLGGIVAGIVADASGYVVDGVLLAPQWAEGMKHWESRSSRRIR